MLNHPWLENILSRHSHQPAGALESLCYNQRFSHTRIDSRGQTRLKSVRILSLGLLLLMTACGGSPPSNAPVVSKLKNRVFLANFQSNVIQIIDAQRDTLSTFTISVSSRWRRLDSNQRPTPGDSFAVPQKESRDRRSLQTLRIAEIGGGGWTRTSDLRIMRPSL